MISNEISNDVLKKVLLALDAIPYFPKGEDSETARAAIAKEIGAMCANHEQLNWLVYMAINRMKAWGGVAGLREILSSRFNPADGLAVESPTDGEQRYFEREAAETDAKLARWNQEMRLLSSAEREANARLLTGFVEQGLAEPKELAMAQSAPASAPRQPSLRELEAQLTALPPTLTEDIKQRRIRIIETELAEKTRVEKILENL